MRLFQSTTFGFAVLILTVAGIVAGNDAGLTWRDWLDAAISTLLFYAGKEGIRYGAEAYRDKQ